MKTFNSFSRFKLRLSFEISPDVIWTPVLLKNRTAGQVSKETVVLRRWGVLQDKLGLSTGLIMRIGYGKEIRKLTFRALALR